jgi:hypothetical protein
MRECAVTGVYLVLNTSGTTRYSRGEWVWAGKSRVGEAFAADV